jgi:DNA repair ATPase RecN
MKIIKLTSQNVKRISAVEITPDGNLITIGGANGAGKSSVLDSIWYALAGGSSIPAKPVRRGEEKAVVELDLGELVVRRTFTSQGGTTLTVTDKDGLPVKSPQGILDKLVGRLTFDPLEFSRQKPAEQAETLRRLVGLDFTAQNQEYERLYAERTAVNRDAKSLSNRLMAMPEHKDAPAAEQSVSAVFEKQRQAVAVNRENDRRRRVAQEKVSDLRTCLFTVDGMNAGIQEIMEKLDNLKKKRDLEVQRSDELKKYLATAQAELLTLKDVDLSPFQAQAAEVEQSNRKVRENAARTDVVAEFKAKTAASDRLDEKLQAIQSAKRKAISAARWPIPGVSFDTAGGVVFNELPFDQASSAEQLRVSVAIGMALNPKLRVLLIKDGSLLDETSLAMIAKMAADSDAQVWMEVVRTDGTVSVVIEDGHVQEGKIQ